jgi:hypothetical protein
MRIVDETRIDEKCRTSALTGLVKPGERYRVVKPSEIEIRLIRMAIEEPKRPKVRVVRVKGRKLLASDRWMTNADTQKVMEQFP